MWVDRDGTVYLYPPWGEPIEPIHPISQPSSFDETMNNYQKRRESEARTERYKAEADYFRVKAENERRRKYHG